MATRLLDSRVGRVGKGRLCSRRQPELLLDWAQRSVHVCRPGL